MYGCHGTNACFLVEPTSEWYLYDVLLIYSRNFAINCYLHSPVTVEMKNSYGYLSLVDYPALIVSTCVFQTFATSTKCLSLLPFASLGELPHASLGGGIW